MRYYLRREVAFSKRKWRWLLLVMIRLTYTTPRNLSFNLLHEAIFDPSKNRQHEGMSRSQSLEVSYDGSALFG